MTESRNRPRVVLPSRPSTARLIAKLGRGADGREEHRTAGCERRMAGSESTARCWICLGDETADEVEEAGMIAPCACVGTNQWVHESCTRAARPLFVGVAPEHAQSPSAGRVPISCTCAVPVVCRPEDVLPAVPSDARGQLALSPRRMSHLQDRLPDHRSRLLLGRLARAAEVELDGRAAAAEARALLLPCGAARRQLARRGELARQLLGGLLPKWVGRAAHGECALQ